MCLGECPDAHLFDENGIRVTATAEPKIVESSEYQKDKVGKVVVTSQLNKLDPTFVEKEFEIEPFVTQPVIVSRSFEAVLKGKDGYPVGKVSCFISWPCYREEFQETLEAVTRVARNEVRKDVEKAKAKLDNERR
jgi:hypothetical protein